jgi:hypothetical protein
MCQRNPPLAALAHRQALHGRLHVLWHIAGGGSVCGARGLATLWVRGRRWGLQASLTGIGVGGRACRAGALTALRALRLRHGRGVQWRRLLVAAVVRGGCGTWRWPRLWGAAVGAPAGCGRCCSASRSCLGDLQSRRPGRFALRLAGTGRGEGRGPSLGGQRRVAGAEAHRRGRPSTTTPHALHAPATPRASRALARTKGVPADPGHGPGAAHRPPSAGHDLDAPLRVAGPVLAWPPRRRGYWNCLGRGVCNVLEVGGGFAAGAGIARSLLWCATAPPQ